MLKTPESRNRRNHTNLDSASYPVDVIQYGGWVTKVEPDLMVYSQGSLSKMITDQNSPKENVNPTTQDQDSHEK